VAAGRCAAGGADRLLACRVDTLARPGRPLTPEDVDRVAAVADPVIRNLLITQAYHDLSAAASARFGRVANWCTFATWASKQAGRTIRKEDLQRNLEAAFRSSPTAAIAAGEVQVQASRFGANSPVSESLVSIWSVVDPAAALDRASAAVARGNLRVFEEIGREFARFEVECGRDGSTEADTLGRFLDRLEPGEPPDGQRFLRQAFSRYHRARFEADPATRAQLVLLANLEIGFHEQTRLQPQIAEALDAAVVDPRAVRDRVLETLFPDAGWLVRLRLLIARLIGRRTLLDVAVDALVVEEQRLVRRILTRHLMSIELGAAVRLQLGEDLGAGVPPSLQEIVLPELVDLLDLIDPTPDSPRESGVVDWADLGDRMHFIAEMFRSYQESPFLFEPPFTPAQLERLEAGERPADPL
jgi:hypothetical protein